MNLFMAIVFTAGTSIFLYDAFPLIHKERKVKDFAVLIVCILLVSCAALRICLYIMAKVIGKVFLGDSVVDTIMMIACPAVALLVAYLYHRSKKGGG